MLATRPRTELQLRERLMRKPWANLRLIDDCILRLKEMGYIDDGRFAESYASHRLSARPVGRARLARELALKDTREPARLMELPEQPAARP